MNSIYSYYRNYYSNTYVVSTIFAILIDIYNIMLYYNIVITNWYNDIIYYLIL